MESSPRRQSASVADRPTDIDWRFTPGALCTIVWTPLGTLATLAQDPAIRGGGIQMWNKSAEAKPSPQASGAAVPVIPEPEVTPLQTRPPSAPAAAPTPTAYTAPQADAAKSLTTIGAGLKINGEISGKWGLSIDGAAR